MSIFKFIGYIPPELFGKTDIWQKIYRQTSSTFYSLNAKCSEITREEEKNVPSLHLPTQS